MSRNGPELWFYRGAAAAGGALAAIVAIRKLLAPGGARVFDHWLEAWIAAGAASAAAILFWVAVRLGVPEDRSVIRAGCRTGLIAGALGFLAGFFGPMLVDASAPQGPLIGILITGPAGAILGTVIGALVARMRMLGRAGDGSTDS